MPKLPQQEKPELPAMTQPAMPAWESSGDFVSDLRDHSTPSAHINAGVKAALADGSLDGYDLDQAVDHPNVDEDTLNAIHDHYANGPGASPEDHWGDRPYKSALKHKNAKPEWSKAVFDKYKSGQKVPNDIVESAAQNPNVPEAELDDLLIHSVQNKDSALLAPVDRVHPGKIAQAYKHLASQPSEDHPDLPYGSHSDSKKEHLLDALLEHKNHTPESLAETHQMLMQGDNSDHAEKFLENQKGLSHNQIEDLYNHPMNKESEYGSKPLTDHAFNHPNVDPNFLASKAVGGTEDEQRHALSSEKLPHEVQMRALQEGLSDFGQEWKLGELLQNKSLSPDIAAAILKHHGVHGEGGRALNHPNVPESALSEAWHASDKNTQDANAFLGRKTVPKDVLKDMVLSSKPAQAAKAVSHPSSDQEVVDTASHRQAKAVQDAVAAHPLGKEKYLKDHITSGKMDSEEYFNHHDENMDDVTSGKMHQHYADQILNQDGRHYKDSASNVGALNLYHSPNISDEQKNQLVDRAFTQVSLGSNNSTEAKYNTALIADAANNGNKNAIEWGLQDPKIADAMELHEASNPQLLQGATNFIASDDGSHYRKAQLVNQITKNPNLSEKDLMTIINSKGTAAASAIAHGALDARLKDKTPEQKQQFFQALASTEKGAMAAMAAPQADPAFRKQLFDQMDVSTLNDVAGHSPAVVKSIISNLSPQEQIAIAHGSKSSDLFGGDRQIADMATKALSPETAPLEHIIGGAPDSNSLKSIFKNLSPAYKNQPNPAADALILNKFPGSVQAYKNEMQPDVSAGDFYRNSVIPNMNDDNAYTATADMIPTAQKGELDSVLDPAQTPAIDPDARSELTSLLLGKDKLSPEAEEKAFAMPGVSATVLSSLEKSPTIGKAKEKAFNEIMNRNGPVSSTEFSTAINALADGNISHTIGMNKEALAKILDYAPEEMAHFDAIPKLIKNIANNPMADDGVAVQQSFDAINNSPRIDAANKNWLIKNSYNALLNNASYGNFGKIAERYAEPVANSIMANNDLDGLFQLATNGDASAPAFKEALNKVASEPEFMAPEHLHSLISNITMGTGLANLTADNFMRVTDTALSSPDEGLRNKAVGLIGRGIGYSASFSPDQSESLVRKAMNLAPKMDPVQRSKLGQSILNSKCSNSDKINALDMLDDSVVRGNSISMSNDILNSDKMLNLAKTQGWAKDHMRAKFGNLSPKNQNDAADSIVAGQSPDLLKSQVADIFRKHGKDIDPTAAQKLFGPNSLEGQSAILTEIAHNSTFRNYASILPQHLANLKLATNSGIDPTTNQPITLQHSIYGLQALANISDARQENKDIMHEVANSALDHANTILDNKKGEQIDADGYNAVQEAVRTLLHTDAVRGVEENDSPTADAGKLNKTVARIFDLQKSGKSDTRPSFLQNAIKHPRMDDANTEHILTQSPEMITHLCQNRDLNAHRIGMVDKVISDKVIKSTDWGSENEKSSKLSRIARDLLQYANPNDKGVAQATALRIGKHCDETYRHSLLDNMDSLDPATCNKLIKGKFAPAVAFVSRNHGGKELYTQTINDLSGQKHVALIAMNDHFDDAGADAVMKHAENKEVAVDRIIRAGDKLSKNKYDQLCEEYPQAVKENMEAVCKSRHLDLERLSKLHDQVAPDYSEFVTRGEKFNPTYQNIQFGAEVFRNNYPQRLPEKIDNVNGRKLLKSQSIRNGTDRLQQAMATIPPQGISWADFKKANKQMENWPEVKSLFLSKNNKPVMPEDIAQAIAAVPEDQYHISYDSWDGLQRHNNNKNLVMQLNTGKSFDKTLGADPKLWNFYQMVQASANGTNGEGSSHPVTPHTVGWIRIDPSSEGSYIVEEFQSDFSQKLKKHIKNFVEQSKGKSFKLGEHSYTEEEANNHIDTIEKAFSSWLPAAYKSLEDIAKKQGIKKIFIHGEGVRKHLSGVDQNQKVGAFDEAYKKMPMKHGYAECNYADYPNYSEDIQRQGINKKCWVKNIE